MKSSTKRVFLMSLFLLAGLGCGEKLDRERAAELISTSEGYPKPIYEDVLVGPSVCVEIRGSRMLNDLDGLRFWQDLEVAGLVELEFLSDIREMLSSRAYYRITLPNVGEYPESRDPMLLDRNREPQENSVAIKIHVCDKILTGITGLRFNSETNATAEYGWKYTNFSKIAQASRLLKSRYGGEEGISNATFCLYDDGWRVCQ